MQSLQYFKKLLTVIIFYDYSYDSRPLSLFSSDLSRTRVLFRFLILVIAFPLSLLAWAILQIISTRYKVSIYVLKTFRPGFASTYLNMMEPLCRQLQHENSPRHIKILVDSGAAVSDALVKSYETHFTLYLDDRRKFARLIAYLIPKSGLEKKFLNTSNKYLKSWLYPLSKNFANLENQVPTDLAKLGIEKGNFVLFAHASENYYRNRKTAEATSGMQYRFYELSTFRQALEEIFENNLKVVRVGVDVDELPTALKTLPIIDYTGEFRNETSELWLYENCRFLLSATSGAYWFAKRFNRPSLLINSYNLLFGYFSTYYTMMLLKNSNSDDLWSLSKTISHRPEPDYLQKSFMKRHNIEFVPNSPKTILNAVKEMLSAYDPSYVRYHDDDEKLIHRYKEILTEFQVPIVENLTLPSISFLREFQHLLK